MSHPFLRIFNENAIELGPLQMVLLCGLDAYSITPRRQMKDLIMRELKEQAKDLCTVFVGKIECASGLKNFPLCRIDMVLPHLRDHFLQYQEQLNAHISMPCPVLRCRTSIYLGLLPGPT